MSGEARRAALFVFAHPDDETLLAGALISKLIDDGWRVHLLCLVPGNDEDLAARMELAAAELGIESVSSLRFSGAGDAAVRDGNSTVSPPLLSAPESVVVSQVAGKMAELSPQMVVTHSPDGDYGHPDHVYCHRVAVAAAQEAAPEAAVFALAWPRSMLWLNTAASRVVSLLSGGFLRRGPGAADVLSDDDSAEALRRLPVTDTHNVRRYLSVRKRAAVYYREQISRGPLPLRLLEAAPTWLQRPVFAKARLSRVR